MFPCVVILVILSDKVVLRFDSVDEILKCDHSNESFEQYIPLILFIMPHKVDLTFESVNEILKCDNSNKSCRAVLPWGAIYFAAQSDSANV